MNASQSVRKDEGEFANVREKMASAIVATIRRQGGCVPRNLAEQGFSEEEIRNYWEKALALAYAELKISER